jgi:hypothetical protein
MNAIRRIWVFIATHPNSSDKDFGCVAMKTHIHHMAFMGFRV